MDGGIGLASGLLTLVVFVFDTTKKLYDAVSSYRSQQTAVQNVLTSLSDVLTLLALVRDHVRTHPRETKLECLRDPLQSCLTVCREMSDKLSECTTHSQDGKNSVRNWLKMQYRGKTLNEMKERLNSHKDTLSIAFDVARLGDGAVTQKKLSDLAEATERVTADLHGQLEDVREQMERCADDLKTVLQEEQARLLSSLESIGQSQQVIETTRPQITVERNVAEDGARGLFGTSGTVPTFDLRVVDNTARGGATMLAGAHSEAVALRAFDTATTPHIALVRQVVQRPGDLQPLLQQLSIQGSGAHLNPSAVRRVVDGSRDGTMGMPGTSVPLVAIEEAEGSGKMMTIKRGDENGESRHQYSEQSLDQR